MNKSNAFKLYIVILLLQCYIVAKAQDATIISGKIYDIETNQPLEGVNVMVQNSTKKNIYGYALTNINGYYSIQYQNKADSILILISGFNIKPQNRLIKSKTQTINFLTKGEAIKIKEITIKAQPIKRRGDTLVYNVSSYLSDVDNSIGDILRKMPGITITQSGEIRYNGLAINKFYIEDVDMLGSRYGIAANNIKANDISRVEVLENHQPIRALKNLTISDHAAINLRLKESAKGIWGNTLKLGMGYKPALWNVEANAMYFGRKKQSINIYKSNNIGDDVANDVFSHDDIESAQTMLEIQNPTTPNIEKQRYLNNNIHLLSTNAAILIGKDIELTANADYVHDLQDTHSKATTTYYKVSDNPLIISEKTDATQRTDYSNLNLKVKSNTEKAYFYNKASFSGMWKREHGAVYNDTNTISQQLKSPNIRLKNDFNGIYKLGDFSFEITSSTNYRSQPISLQISPMIYPEIFYQSGKGSGTRQNVNITQFSTDNSIRTSFSMKRWSIDLKAGLSINMENMKSDLSPIGTTTEPNSDMFNNIYWKNIKFNISSGISYTGKKTSVYLNFPVDFANQQIENKIYQETNKYNNIYTQPNLFIQSSLTNNLKLSAHALYNESHGNLYDFYSGFIMTNYRNIQKKKTDINPKRTQNYSISLSYGNAIRALFSSLNIVYQISKQKIMYSTIYDGSLTYIEAIRRPNKLKKYNINYTVGKNISNISTTFNSLIGYSHSNSSILRENKLMNISSNQFVAELKSNTRFTKAIHFNYEISYIRNRTFSESSTTLNPIHMLQQSATLNFIFAEKIIWNIKGEYYYDKIENTHNTVFLDTRLTYKKKSTEYSFHIYNLLAKKRFHSASYSNMTTYVYDYDLRPITIMFNVKFNF